jgi:alpha-L-rhamnosidase
MLWLGSGWYTEGLPGVVSNGPLVKAQLEKVENNQRTIMVATDASWLGRKSSYTRHGNWRSNRFGGEIIDGSLAKSDLTVENNQVRNGQPVTIVDVPPHQVSPQMVECNVITDTIKPVAVVQMAQDTFLVDMGKNLTGWVEMHFSNLLKSQEITIEYCDHLQENRIFNDRNQFDRYIASGEGSEVFVNKFNYHGFRYLRITNLKEIPHIDSIRAYLIHTNYERVSGFECSDPI